MAELKSLLNRHGLFELLAECRGYAHQKTIEQLQDNCKVHMETTAMMHSNNNLVNLSLAKAIEGSLRQLLKLADTVSTENFSWIKAAAEYFVRTKDEEDDFTSALGFEDDAEVLNAVCVLVDREDLVLKIEDFDGV